jgi:hypothetical protein
VHATPLDVTHLYDDLAGQGYEYGPAFRAVTAAWHAGDTTWVELTGPEQANQFTVHPALLDAALHLAGLADLAIPFTLTGVRLATTAATRLLVRLTRLGDDTHSVLIADGDGRTVASIDAVLLRPGTGAGPDGLYRTDWVPAPRPAAEPTRGRVVPIPRGLTPRAATALALDAVRGSDERVVVVTTGAVAVTPDEDVDPAAAAVWGLMRTAITEFPGRCAVADVDDPAAVATALATGSGRPNRRAP